MIEKYLKGEIFEMATGLFGGFADNLMVVWSQVTVLEAKNLLDIMLVDLGVMIDRE